MCIVTNTGKGRLGGRPATSCFNASTPPADAPMAITPSGCTPASDMTLASDMSVTDGGYPFAVTLSLSPSP
jgi:hypothetical protein